MVVVDLSMTGLKLKMNFSPPFASGDLLDITFQLDDQRRTSISKKVKVMNVSGSFVGRFSQLRPPWRRARVLPDVTAGGRTLLPAPRMPGSLHF